MRRLVAAETEHVAHRLGETLMKSIGPRLVLPERQTMTSNALIPILMLFTLGAGLLIAIVLLMRFLRKPSNRHPMDGQPERKIEDIRGDGGNI